MTLRECACGHRIAPDHPTGVCADCTETRGRELQREGLPLIARIRRIERWIDKQSCDCEKAHTRWSTPLNYISVEEPQSIKETEE